jgi:hypothetical protein
MVKTVSEPRLQAEVEVATSGVSSRRIVIGVIGLVSIAALAGCAGESKYGGDPGARPLPPGSTCESVRGDLNKLDSKGVPSQIEAAQAGRKLSANQQADVDRYNKLLNDYLGARCHVVPGH